MTTDDPGLVDDTPLVAALEPFDAFYRREYRPVLGLASVLCGDVAAAEDLTQDAFISTMRDWERVGQMDNPAGEVPGIVGFGYSYVDEIKGVVAIGTLIATSEASAWADDRYGAGVVRFESVFTPLG